MSPRLGITGRLPMALCCTDWLAMTGQARPAARDVEHAWLTGVLSSARSMGPPFRQLHGTGETAVPCSWRTTALRSARHVQHLAPLALPALSSRANPCSTVPSGDVL